MKFILFRVLAFTVIVGAAALVLSLLFKLLIGATILLGIAFAAKKALRRHGNRGHDAMAGDGFNRQFGFHAAGAAPFASAWQRDALRRPAGIIPIS